MKTFQRGLIALSSVFCLGAAICANASEVLTIPASAAHPYDGDPSACIPGANYYWGPDGATCYLTVPLTIPVGHTIQQVAIVHSTDSMIPGAPFIQSFVGDLRYASPLANDTHFLWTSWDYVPDGTFEAHRLMKQIVVPGGGTTYPDAFVVAPDTAYYVFLQIENESFWGVRVTYN